MNEFIARKGIISLDNAQITGSLSVTGNISASIFTGSFVGDGSQLSGVEGFPYTGSAGITGSLTVVGPVNATTFTGDGSQLTGIEGFPFTGSAGISGSLTVVGPVNATSFTGSLQGTATSASYIQLANIDGFTAYSSSVNTAIDSVLDATTPLTATVNTGSSPFTLTSQSIVVADSTNGNLTINLPDLNTIVGTPNQKPIVVYKNDYSQNVIYVNPSGSQLVNGASQDIIVSIQLAVIYNPTSAGWVTEGTSAQSLAELELFFLPLTETGSLATTGSNTFIGNQTVTGSLTVTGGINAAITGSATSASYVEYTNVANKPALVSGSAQVTYSGLTGVPAGIVSGSSQVTYSGLTGVPSGIVSSSTQIGGYGIFATTGSNQFNGSQAITGSLTVTGQVVAQTLNVQQVTSSIIFSSGSNIFGNSLGNTQQFTGSVSVTGSLTVNGVMSLNNDGTYGSAYKTLGFTGNTNGSHRIFAGTSDDMFFAAATGRGLDFRVSGSANSSLYIAATGAAIFSGPTVTIGTAIAATNVKLILNGVTSKAAGIEFHQSGTPQWYIGNGIASEDNNFELYNSNGTMAMKIIKSTNTINFIGSNEVMNISGTNATSAYTGYYYNTSTLVGYIGNGTSILSGAASSDFIFRSQGALVYATNGNNERMRITSGGNVGIGTSNPSATLDIGSGKNLSGTDPISVYTDVRVASAVTGGLIGYNLRMVALAGSYTVANMYGIKTNTAVVQSGVTVTNSYGIYIGRTDDPTSGGIVTNKYALVTEATAGNVGIGTTSPTYRTEVALSVSAYWNGTTFTGGNPSALSINNTTNGGYDPVLLLQQTDSGGTTKLAGGIGLVGTGPWTAGDNATQISDMYFLVRNDSGGISERLRIKSGGNVGIGTNNPSQKLEVVGGEIKAGRVDSSSEGGQVSFGRASDNATGWYIDAFGSTSSPALRFVNVSDSAVVMTMSGGNIGIGTTDLTSTRLRIKSSTTGSSNFVLYTEDSAANILFWVRDDGYINTGSRTSSPYNLTSGNAANMVVGADGTLYRSTSSLKYKTDIRNYTKGLNEVLGLRPVFYKGKTDGDTQFAGLIAEEVHELGLTEFVQYAPDGSPDALSYQNMIALAFKAIQEQQAQIESLKAEIQTLKQ